MHLAQLYKHNLLLKVSQQRLKAIGISAAICREDFKDLSI